MAIMTEALRQALEDNSLMLGRSDFEGSKAEVLIRLGLYAIIFCEGGKSTSKDFAWRCFKAGVPTVFYPGGLNDLTNTLYTEEKVYTRKIRPQIERIPNPIVLKKSEYARRDFPELTTGRDGIANLQYLDAHSTLENLSNHMLKVYQAS